MPIYGNAYVDPEIGEKLVSYGRMGVHLGDYKDTEGNRKNGKTGAYRIVPDENNMIKAKLKVNSFRPYLGFGYGGSLSKHSDMYHLYVNCGVMFWGGKPKMPTHDGTDLINDVENIGGSIGKTVDFFGKFVAYPVLEVRLAHKIF